MSALLDALYSLGGGILDVLDMPGSYTRGALAGRFGDRLSGRDMLEEWGLLDENQEGLDGGDIAGFAADVVVDPLNFLGGGKLLSALKARKPAVNASLVSGVVDSADEFADLSKLATGKLNDDGLGLASAMEGDAIAKALSDEGKEYGRVVMMAPKPSEAGAAARGWPELVPEDALVSRVSGSYLDDAAKGQGIGQQMYVDAMNASPADWFYNSGNSDAASRALESLREKGLIDLHWQRRGPGGPKVMRLTDAGRELAGTGGLVHDPRNPKIAPLLAALLGYNTLNLAS